jgi:hypothetical protein
MTARKRLTSRKPPKNTMRAKYTTPQRDVVCMTPYMSSDHESNVIVFNTVMADQRKLSKPDGPRREVIGFSK